MEATKAIGRITTTTAGTDEDRAISWVVRQIRWERTLDALRAARPSFPKAA